MHTNRFFLSPQSIENNHVYITGDQAHQIRDVLRMKCGEQCMVLDNTGYEYQTEIVEITDKVTGKILTRDISSGEPKIKIILYQALLKGSKFDIILQKNTEIGISYFVPVICDRSIVRCINSTRMERWRKIVTEAAEQSGRGRIPCIENPVDFGSSCSQIRENAILLDADQTNNTIESVIGSMAKPDTIKIFVGPEGGFTGHEKQLAARSGISIANLGRRILRADTAGIVAASILLYEYGEFGG